MGFFSSLIKGIGAIASPILGALGFIPPRAAPAPAAAVLAVPPRIRIPSVTPSALAARGVISPGAAAVGARIGGGLLPAPTVTQRGPLGIASTTMPLRGGNGRFVRDTVVTTTNLDTGEIVRQVQLDGAPFLMNKDVQKLRQTAKKLTRAHGKLPRRTVKESLTKQLTDAAVKAALDATRCSSHKE